MSDVVLPVPLQMALRAAVIRMLHGASGVAEGGGMHNYGLMLLAHPQEAVDYMAAWMEELTGCAWTVFQGDPVIFPRREPEPSLLRLVVGHPGRQRGRGAVLRVCARDDRLFMAVHRVEPSSGLMMRVPN
jgi:hypothetical protein